MVRNQVYRAAILFVLAMMASTAAARAVDVATAREQATSLLTTHNHGILSKADVEMRLIHIERSTVNAAAADYYVFNASDGSAFAIIAGDDRARAILARGDHALDMSRLPCNLQYWLEQYREQMEYLLAHPGLMVQTLAQPSMPVVAPLLTCTWNQTRPYNNECPVFNGTRCVTGCVATAMAQVMYRWKYPAQAPALPAYTTSKNKIALPALPQAPLAWEDMLDDYRGDDYTESQALAVATLMRYCGQSCKMDYGTSSAAHTFNQLSGVKMFGYNSSAVLLSRYDYSDSAWVELICEDLVAGRPLLYSGSSGTGFNHAFVVDGTDGNMLHVNWGWGGSGDGYYALDAFIMQMNSGHSMIYHLYPEDQDGLVPVYDFAVDGIYYQKAGSGLRVVPGPEKYSGHIVIPAQVENQGVLYPVTAVTPGAFMGCVDLSSVEVGPSVTTIGNGAFSGCLNLKRVSIPESVLSIGRQAFLDCTALDTVDIMSLSSWCQIDFRDDEACPFHYAHHLRVNGDEVTQLIIPDGVTTIGRNLFRNCTSLVGLTVPNTVTAINSYAFYRCTSLETVRLSDRLESLGYCTFAGCKKLTAIDLPPSLRQIDRYAFKDCEHLTAIVIPDSIRVLGTYTFYNCKRLATVTLGCGLDSLASSLFTGCKQMAAITCRALVPPVVARKSTFDSSNYANAVLRVPRCSLSAYREAEFWSLFETVVAIDAGGGPMDLDGDGEVSIADLNILLGAVLGAVPGSGSGDCDVDGDGEASITDVNLMIASILDNAM